jgi:hypothetical protein
VPHALLIVLAAAALALAGCGGGDDTGYPDEAVDSFMEACTDQMGSTEEACRCVVDRLEQMLPYEEFAAADDAIREGRTPSENAAVKLQLAVEQCR